MDYSELKICNAFDGDTACACSVHLNNKIGRLLYEFILIFTTIINRVNNILYYLVKYNRVSLF